MTSGYKPEEVLCDGGCTDKEEIVEFAKDGIATFTPIRSNAKPPKEGEKGSEALTQWWDRMQTEEGKKTYRMRGSSIEFVNANVKERFGMRQLPGRGSQKAMMMGLWMGFVFNLCSLMRIATSG